MGPKFAISHIICIYKNSLVSTLYGHPVNFVVLQISTPSPSPSPSPTPTPVKRGRPEKSFSEASRETQGKMARSLAEEKDVNLLLEAARKLLLKEFINSVLLFLICSTHYFL